MDFRRLFDILAYQESKYPQKVAIAHKQGYQWESYSTKECIDLVNQISAGALDLGLKKGDKIALISHTGSAIWNILDFGMQQIGVVVVPIHAVISLDDLIFILKDANAKYCFVSNAALYEKVDSIKSNVLSLKQIFSFEKIVDVPHWKELLTLPDEVHFEKLHTFQGVIHEDDLATIIYTSGTTGRPKGVMLSHKNIVSSIKSIITLVPVNCDKRVVSFLPLSHIFERMVTYTYLAVGASLYYIEYEAGLIDQMKALRPHFFTSVPRMLEKMYEAIKAQGKQKGRLSKKTLDWAIKLGKRYNGRRNISLGYWLKLAIANSLVFRHWRKSLGNKVEGISVGAAALQPELARLFSAAGIEIREGYGLTETAPVVAFNHFEPGLFLFGTVGIPAPGVEVKINEPDEEGAGEILVKGPNVMLGYHNQPEATKEVITEDGWFRTGDVGKFVNKRFLQITDRKKDIFKTSSGKYVAPQVVENQLKSSSFVEQCLAIGFQRPFVSALIVPSFVNLKSWCEENDVHWTAPPYMILNPKVIEKIEAVIEKCNESLASHAKIRRFKLLHEEWTIESGEVSPTLKIMRNVVIEKFSKEIEEIYKE